MTDINCEKFGLAEMALADGEESPLSREEIETHLRNCDHCRAQVEAVRTFNERWNSQERSLPPANLWPLISERLDATPESNRAFNWRLLLLFGLPLFGYKILSLVFAAAPTLWSRLVPVILAIAVFAYLKTNPFKINCELTATGDFSS